MIEIWLHIPKVCSDFRGLKRMMGLIFILLFSLGSFAQDKIGLTDDGRNEILIHNVYIDTTVAPPKTRTNGYGYSFTGIHDLAAFLETVPDSFNTAIIYYDSFMYLPDNFFVLRKLQFLQIMAPVISDFDKRFSLLPNLKVVEVTCDTLLKISNDLIELRELNIMEFDVRKYYSPKLEKQVRKICRHSKSEDIGIALGSYHCWTKEDGNGIECTGK